MYIHQVPRGTEFTFTFDDETQIEGTFDGNIDHMQFNILCPQISKNIDIYKDKQPTVEFLSGETYYNFKAKILGVSARKEAIHDSLEMVVVTPFKEAQRREEFKINIALKVRIHDYNDDFKKLYSSGWVCDALSDNVSKNGIRLWADYALDATVGTMFTLEFSLRTGWIYMIPARLTRSKPNTATHTATRKPNHRKLHHKNH